MLLFFYSGFTQTTVTYTTQTANFNNLQTERNIGGGPYAGTYNNGGTEIAQYANGGSFSNTPGAAAFETFSITGNGNSGTARSLKVGDRFTITAYTGSNPSGGGRIGISFRNTVSVANFFSSTDANTVANFQLDNTGGWKIYTGATSVQNAGATSGTDRVLSIEITSSNTFNATIDGTTYYDLVFAATGPIVQFCIYTYGDNNPNAFWKNASLANIGHAAGAGLRFGNDQAGGTRTISGIIADGINTNSTSGTLASKVLTASANGLLIFNGTNTYTGSTGVVSNSRLELQSAQALGATSAVTVQNNAGLSLYSPTGISFNSYPTTLNGGGQGGSNGALRSTGGINTWPGAITLASASRINADISGGAGSLALTGNIALGSNNLSIGATAAVSASGVISGSGALIKDGTNTLTLTGSNTYSGGTVLNAGTISISAATALGTNNVTIGNGATTGILNVTDNAAFTQGIIVTDASTAAVMDVASTKTLTLQGLLSQTGTNASTKFGKSGAGALVLSGTSTYPGQIQIGQGTVIVNSNNGVGTNTSTTNRAVDLGLNVGDVSQPNNVAFLINNNFSATQSIYVSANTGGATRTIGINGGTGSGSYTNEIYLDGNLTIVAGSGVLSVSGNIVHTGNLLVNGGGTVAFGGANTFSGGITIDNTVLRIDAAERLPNTSAIILTGGTINTNSGFSETVGTLTLTAATASSIVLGSNAHSLTFANSSGETWGNGATLTILQWTGTAGQSNTSGGKIFVGVGGLTLAQRQKITFQGYVGTPVILPSGELVPPGPALSITAGAADHGTSCISTAATAINYTITNTGAAANGISVVSDNPEFAVSNVPASVAGNGGTANYSVTFTPSASGARSANISISTSTPNSNSPVISALTGTGNAATAISTAAAPLSQTVAQNATPTNLTLSASGTAPVNYQWYSNTTNSNSGGTSLGNTNGAQTSTYTPSTAALGTIYYYAVATGACGPATSSVVSVTVSNTGTWTAGGGNNDWSNPSNWSNSAVPTALTNASIPAGATPYPSVTGAAQVRDLNVAAGATLNISASAFTINGILTGTGTLSTGTGTTLTIAGTGAFGTLYFDQATDGSSNAVGQLILNRTGGTVSLGNKLVITNKLTPTAGVLTTGGLLHLRSTAAQTAAIGQGSTSGNYISGDVTVERYLSGPADGLNNRAWRMLSVPTMGSQSIHNAWQEGQAAGEVGTPGYGTNISSSAANWSTSGFDFQTLSGSLQTYNPVSNNYNYVSSTNTPIATTSGYFLYLRGDRTVSASAAVTGNTSTTLRSKGGLYQGDRPGIAVGANKFAMIGNIYASAIDFEKMRQDAVNSNTGLGGGLTSGNPNHTGTFYVWDPRLSNNGSLGGYQTFSSNSGYSAVPGGGSYGGSNSRVESGQAFFVYAAGTAGALTLKESYKEDGSNNVARPSAIPPQFRTNLYRTNTATPELADGNIAVFDSAYSNAVDGDDALKLPNFDENIAILRDNNNLVIEARQALTDTDTIYFNMWNMQPHGYKFSFVTLNWSAVGAGLTAFLQDNYLGTTTPINLAAATEVNFNVTNVAASSAATRFRVVFRQSAPVPVTFTSVVAAPKLSGIQVDWKVAGERGITQYIVERSADGRSFSGVGTINASGRSDYGFFDRNPLMGINFYRIKYRDASSNYKYTYIVQVLMANSDAGFTISPNPIENHTVNLQFSNQSAGVFNIRLLNSEGQLLYTSKVVNPSSNGVKQLILPMSIPQGHYQLEIGTSDGKTSIKKLFIK